MRHADQPSGPDFPAHYSAPYDVTSTDAANGTRLQIWDCHDSANQQWNLPS